MKVPQSLRDSHLNQTPIYESLKKHVDNIIINNLKDPRWHYESRLKSLESFALKIETGNYPDPTQMEDFFACTLVVENLSSMVKAEKLICNRFELYERRPKSNNFTSKPSDSFRFDDTRLYVRWKDDAMTRPTSLNGVLFEVQVKTFLAHAWGIATHDLTYKTDEKSWSKERIAFQIKAMLEHAEISIEEARKLANSTSLKKTDKYTENISKIIETLNKLWPASHLPNDKKRLAENIYSLLRSIDVDLAYLSKILNKETKIGKGTKTLNLSPYSVIVQSLCKLPI